MKKLIYILILLLVFTVSLKAQDSTATVNNYYRGVLTASKDTFQVNFSAFNASYRYSTVTVWTTSAADTIYVDTRVRSATNNSFVSKLLYNLTAGTTHTFIVATTTKTEYAIIDPEPAVIRLRTTDVTVNSVFIAQARTGNLETVLPSTLFDGLEGSLTNIEADADSIVDKVTEIDTTTKRIRSDLIIVKDSVAQITNTVKEIDDSTKQVTNTIKQVRDSTIQITNTLKEIDDSTKQITNTIKVIKDSTAQITNTVKAIEDTTHLIRSELITIKGYELASQDSLAQITIVTKASRDTLHYVRVDLAALHSDLLANGIKIDSTDASLARIEGYINDLESKNDSLKAKLNDLKGYVDGIETLLTPTTNWYAQTRTTVAAADSVVFGFSTRYNRFTNDGVSTDTCFISTQSTFTSTTTKAFIGGETVSFYGNYPKLYIKVGTTPVAGKKIRIFAN